VARHAPPTATWGNLNHDVRQLYYDTLVFTSEAPRHLAAEVGVSQLMLGTTAGRLLGIPR
jgi:hypothetical protein